MMKFKTSTQIAPVIDVGTYWGMFDYENLWSADEDAEREEGNYVCDDYSHKKLGEAIVDEATEVFKDEKPFEEYGVKSIRAVKFGSPREYNFMDDWLELEIDVDDSFFDLAEKAIFAPERRKYLEKYIEDEWCSHDGFISSMPCTVNNWKRYPAYRYEDPYLDEMHSIIRGLKDKTSDDEWRHFGAVIALLYVIDLKEKRMMDDCDQFWGSLTERLLERFTENHSLDEFCTIVEPDEVAEKYPLVPVLTTRADEGESTIRAQLDRYMKLDGIPEEDKRRVEDEAKASIKWIDGFCDKVRGAVESFHPGDPDRVVEKLEELREEWVGRFGEMGDAPLKDLPGQALLGL